MEREGQIDPSENMRVLYGCRVGETGLMEQAKEKGGRKELGKMSRT